MVIRHEGFAEGWLNLFFSLWGPLNVSTVNVGHFS